MKFNELDLRHSASFLYKLNHLKTQPDYITYEQILALFYSSIFIIKRTEDNPGPYLGVGDLVSGSYISLYKSVGSTDIIGFTNGITTLQDDFFVDQNDMISVTLIGVQDISNNAFHNCINLESLSFDDSLLQLRGDDIFLNCDKLSSLIIPKNVSMVSSYAGISALPSITTLKVDKDNPIYDSRENCNAIIETATNKLIVGCRSTVIPSSVQSIGTHAFVSCPIQDIEIPSGVRSIDDYAFHGCDLIRIAIPETVTWIGEGALGGCTEIYCAAIEPPACLWNSMDSSATVYIPCGTKSAYASAPGWEECNLVEIGCAEPEEGEYVDLGLPSGILWATRNVGANSPEEYGDYFAWGETEPKDVYGWSNYKWGNGKNNALTKYNTDSSYGTVDNKTVLEADDDAATANWGGNWRMPTEAERYELETHCTWEWTTHNGVNCYKGISNNNGKSIFLPAAGSFGSGLHNVGTYCSYWTSSLNTDSPVLAYRNAQGSVSQSTARYYGFSVRPVCTSPSPTPDPEPDLEKCGENAYYSVNDGVLTISGEGIIDDCASDSAPWAREEINEVVIEEGITVLGAHMLRGSNITSVTIPNSVTTINTYAFYGCKNLQEVTIGSSLTRINSSAFNSCPNITRVNVGSIEQWCGIKFDGGITANPMNSNNAVLYVNGSAMYDIVVPEGVTVLRNYVFDGNHITSLTLPSTLTEIQSQAIGGCSNCTTITCYAQTPPKMSGKNQISSVTAVYVPAGCAQAYKEASNWANYGNLIVEL